VIEHVWQKKKRGGSTGGGEVAWSQCVNWGHGDMFRAKPRGVYEGREGVSTVQVKKRNRGN